MSNSKNIQSSIIGNKLTAKLSNGRRENRRCNTVKSLLSLFTSSNVHSMFVISTMFVCFLAITILPSSTVAGVVPLSASAAHLDDVNEDSAIVANENALTMLRNYFKGLQQYENGIESLDYPNPAAGYFLLEDIKSNKRGLGPRPLRFGRR